MAHECVNYSVDDGKLPLGQSIEVVKSENDCKLVLGTNHILNRRSYNEYMGSENFINLLDGEQCKTLGHASFDVNFKADKVVSSTLYKGDGGLTPNSRCFCVLSRQFARRDEKQLQRSSPMDAGSDFASQTLKQCSLQNLDAVTVDESEFLKEKERYKLKESSPGCLPSKGKSKKLQRKLSERMEDNDCRTRAENRAASNEKYATGDVCCETTECDPSSKATRRKSLFSSLKFIKLKKFRKKRKPKAEFREASDGTNWDTESAESSEEQQLQQREGETSCEDTEFIFGGVRVLFDENGDCYEIEEAFDLCSNSSSSSDEQESGSNAAGGRGTRTGKFESLDSLNLGYSGSFVS